MFGIFLPCVYEHGGAIGARNEALKWNGNTMENVEDGS